MITLTLFTLIWCVEVALSSLGPLLFCLTLHPLLFQLQSELKIFYLDDGMVGGSTEIVQHNLHYLESGADELGLHFNQSKSELICDDMFSI